ncbi:MAG: PAS domain S-box protein [Planctomycetota bacterium]
MRQAEKMNDPDPSHSLGDRFPRLRISVILVLCIGYVLLGCYFELGLKIGIVYTHFAYIPIVLSGLWWGRKSIIVAVALAAMFIPLHFFSPVAGSTWSGLARAAFFVVVAVTVGSLREKIALSQEALKSSKARYKLLIEKSLSGVFVYHEDRILFCSEQFARLMGYTSHELVSLPVWDIIHSSERSRIREMMEQRRRGEMSDLHYEAKFVTRVGQTIWMDIASSPLEYEDHAAVLVNAYDITTRKEAEQKRRDLMKLAHEQEEQLVHSTRLAELGEMAAAIAHEINQPLTGIRNFAKNASYMIEHDVGGIDDIQENLDQISKQVDRASKIIKQMRQLTRKSEPQLSLVSMNAVLDETLQFLAHPIRLAGVEVSLDMQEGLPEIMGDTIRLEQVFLNIISNAIQAMEGSETRRLTIRTCLDAAGDHPVIVEISDTGKGFGPDVSEKLFTPFFSTKEPGEGTGLGLPISLRIIKDHDGMLDAEGKPGAGASFTMKFPLPGKESECKEALGSG